MSLLGMLSGGGIVISLVIILLFARLAKSSRLTSAFEVKVSDDELASKVIRSLFSSTYPLDMTEENIWGSSKVVYKSVYLDSHRPNRDDLKMLEAILDDRNERAAVAFLKSKTRGYKGVMHEKADDYCRDAASIMAKIK